MPEVAIDEKTHLHPVGRADQAVQRRSIGFAAKAQEIQGRSRSAAIGRVGVVALINRDGVRGAEAAANQGDKGGEGGETDAGGTTNHGTEHNAPGHDNSRRKKGFRNGRPPHDLVHEGWAGVIALSSAPRKAAAIDSMFSFLKTRMWFRGMSMSST